MPSGGFAQQHWLLNRRAGWRAAQLDKTLLADDGACLRLQVLPGTAKPIVDAAGTLGGLVLPIGLAVDAEDRIYILDAAAGLVKRFDPCKQAFEVVPCIGGPGGEPRQVRDPRGLATSCQNDLYIVDAGNRRIQVFALKGLPLRAIWGPLRVIRDGTRIRVERARTTRPAPDPNGVCSPDPIFPEGTWQPWDIALTCEGRAYVSDYANGLIHLFDARGKWRAAFNGESPDAPPLTKPTRIAIDKAGRVYVLQEGKDFVTVLDANGQYLKQIAGPDEVKGEFCPIAIAVDRDGNLCLGERFSRRVHMYCMDGGGAHAYAGECRTFDGLCVALAFDSAGNPLVADAQGKQVFCLQAKAAYVPEGQYVSEALDSLTYRCQWHRVRLHASIAPGARVLVETFTSEAPKSAVEVLSLPDSRWATARIDASVGEGEWDCLIQSLPGRYLWLRLTLAGDGATTPQVNWVEVYYPRASSLQFLPAVYREDEDSREFLDRFLSIFDTVWGGVADHITALARYFDPKATPAEAPFGQIDFLTWLAGWLGLSLDRHWPVEKRRRLLAQAHRLYALRGTPEGLRLHVQIYLDLEPRILEHFKLRRWLYVDYARLGEQAALWGDVVMRRLQLDAFSRVGEFQLMDSGDPLRDPFHHSAHQFSVFVPLRGGGSEAQQRTLERIVELAKPAHTQARLAIVEPRFRIGVQSFIGIDTVVGEYPDRVVAGEGKLGYDTVLGPSPDESERPTLRVGVRSRIGSSTLID